MRSTVVVALASVAGAALLGACSAQGTIQATNPTSGNTSSTGTPSTSSASQPTDQPSNQSGGQQDGQNGQQSQQSGGNPVQQAGASNNSQNCHSSELKLTLGPADHAMMHTNTSLVFTNTGGRTCTLQGFPGVSFVTGNSGQQVGQAASRSGSLGAAVTLHPGDSTSAPLSITSTGPYSAADCQQVDTRGLRVYPPNETAAMFLPLPEPTCSGNVGPLLSVRTMGSTTAS